MSVHFNPPANQLETKQGHRHCHWNSDDYNDDDNNDESNNDNDNNDHDNNDESNDNSDDDNGDDNDNDVMITMMTMTATIIITTITTTVTVTTAMIVMWISGILAFDQSTWCYFCMCMIEGNNIKNRQVLVNGGQIRMNYL